MEDIDKFWDGTTTISGGEQGGERELTKEEKKERAKQVRMCLCVLYRALVVGECVLFPGYIPQYDSIAGLFLFLLLFLEPILLCVV